MRRSKSDLSKFVRAAPERARLAEALGEIRAQTRMLSKARFEKLVAEAVAFARRRR